MGLWLTPLILLPGVALLIMSTSLRYNHLHEADGLSETGRAHLMQRARFFFHALVSLYVCVGLFSLASLLGMLTAASPDLSAWIVLPLTALGVLSLTFAAVQLVRESILAHEVIEEHGRRLGN